VTRRREFLQECGKAFAALMFTAACDQEKLHSPRPRPISPDFFGHMIQGEWILDDGSLARPVTVYFGVLRLWDSRAVWWKMENDPTALEANLLYAESVGADAMFVFGEPPQSAVVPGKSKMPTKDAWVSFVREIARERIRFVELWNEPAEGYWDGTPEELADYCRSRIRFSLQQARRFCRLRSRRWALTATHSSIASSLPAAASGATRSRSTLTARRRRF
jgi:hypothetical protein